MKKKETLITYDSDDSEYINMKLKTFVEDDLKERKGKKIQIDHVKSNIVLTGKINKIKDIQLFYRNFIKNQNQK